MADMRGPTIVDYVDEYGTVLRRLHYRCDWCGAKITPTDSEDGLCARCARIAQEQDEEEFERPEFPIYVGWDGQEHAEY